MYVTYQAVRGGSKPWRRAFACVVFGLKRERRRLLHVVTSTRQTEEKTRGGNRSWSMELAGIDGDWR